MNNIDRFLISFLVIPQPPLELGKYINIQTFKKKNCFIFCLGLLNVTASKHTWSAPQGVCVKHVNNMLHLMSLCRSMEEGRLGFRREKHTK